MYDRSTSIARIAPMPSPWLLTSIPEFRSFFSALVSSRHRDREKGGQDRGTDEEKDTKDVVIDDNNSADDKDVVDGRGVADHDEDAVDHDEDVVDRDKNVVDDNYVVDDKDVGKEREENERKQRERWARSKQTKRVFRSNSIGSTVGSCSYR